jgi:hypothetical protein
MSDGVTPEPETSFSPLAARLHEHHDAKPWTRNQTRRTAAEYRPLFGCWWSSERRRNTPLPILG